MSDIKPSILVPFYKVLYLCYLCVLLMAWCALAASSVRADGPSAQFDLIGPSVRARVTRNGETLPISAVAALRAGDKLWIAPDFPDDQSARYLLIVAFLQGSTNPPPENWFTRVETWRKDVREQGITLTVPENAQQALLFLAPDTGGGFASLRSTVRGKPGVFVRAAEDLDQASLDRTRLDKFLEEIQKTSASDSAPLAERAALLSRTLAVKADPQCFTKPMDEQSSCLTQNTNGLTLQETPGQSVVASLTTGASADLVGAFGDSPIAKGGYYSPYIGSALDIVRLLNSLHTAEFQYLPALVSPVEEELNLRLNAPPSFHTPRSVLVVGLPQVAPAGLPLLQAVDAKQIYCLQATNLVLPVEGAPLVFSTGMAHDFTLAIQNKFGQQVNLPAFADAARGGFVIDLRGVQPDQLDPEIAGMLRGSWGFQPYEGPLFHFQNAHSVQWQVPSAGASALLIGRDETLRLAAGDAACVEKVTAEDGAEKDLKLTWKALAPDQIELRLPLKDRKEGAELKVSVQQFGLPTPDVIAVHAYAEAAQLDGFHISAGDSQGVLTGTRLDQVSGFELAGVRFVPAKLTHGNRGDSLGLRVPHPEAVAALPPGENLVARVTLRDGRVLELQTAIEPPRPKVSLVSKSVKRDPEPSAVRLGNEDELPQNGELSFLLKTVAPEKFPHSEQIEIATMDGSADWFLSVANGGLVLQDSEDVLAILDPLKNLGPSAFGPLQFRPVDSEGEKGDWQPLARLVRIPVLKEVRCPADAEKPCVLGGSNLFLLDSISADPGFGNPVAVPPGYTDTSISVPRPSGTLLYVKLRDDPSVVNSVALPVLPDTY